MATASSETKRRDTRDTPADADALLRDAELLAADAIGDIIEHWGFRKVLGRVWTVLFIAAEPLPAADVGERLAMSAGSVSTSLTELQRWGVVRRVFLDGNRQEHFVAENNVWKMVSRVFRERELVEIVEAISAFEQALAATDANDGVRRERIGSLLEISRLGRAVVEALVGAGQVDVAELAKRLFLGSDRK